MTKQYTNVVKCIVACGVIVTSLFIFSQQVLAQSTSWGNEYMLGNSNTATVNTSNSQWVTFTAQSNETITQARLNANSVVSSPVLDVGLYAVDGSGVPTGSALTTGTVTASATGWTNVDLGDYAIVKGTTYALRVSTATSGASFGWRYNQENPANNLQPIGAVDTHWRRGNNANAPAVIGQNVWILETSSGTSIGQPYFSATAQGAASSTNTLGQRFKFDLAGAGGNDVLKSVDLYLGVAATPPSNPVTLKVISAAGIVLATTTLDLSGAPTGAAIRTFNLSSTISLTDGESYYIGLYSNGSAGNSVTWYGWNVSDEAAYRSTNFQGDNAYAVTWGSQSNFTSPTATMTRDYYFGLNVIPEPSVIGLAAMGLTLAFLGRRRFRK